MLTLLAMAVLENIYLIFLIGALFNLLRLFELGLVFADFNDFRNTFKYSRNFRFHLVGLIWDAAFAVLTYVALN